MHKHTLPTTPRLGRKARRGRRLHRRLPSRPAIVNLRVERIIRASRQRIATELWDLVSPNAVELAAEVALSVSGSKFFTQRLAIDRPPRRSGWRKALLFHRLGVVIGVLYALYLLVALAITLPVLAVAFVLDLWERILLFFTRRR